MRALIVALAVLALATSARAGTPAPGYTDTAYVSGLSLPTSIAFLPDGTLLIAEKAGALKLWNGATVSTLGTIPVCGTTSEMGLLGVAVDPAFGTNGFIYLYRTHQGTPNVCSTTGRVNEVVRVTKTGTTIGPITVLLTGARTDGGNHDGGGLRIGPDGKLYAGIGDTGNGDNVGCPGTASNPYAQDLNALEGKLVRLNLDGTIPSDNPFFGQAGKRGEIFASGFRNPFRFGFDPANGNLWVADVGDLAFEEIDIVTSGSNYAWPHCEATRPTGCEQAGDVDPIFAYSHGGSCPGESTLPSLGTCIIGGGFAGPTFGALDGDYFFGDCTSSTLYHATLNGTRDGIVGTPDAISTSAGTPSDVIFGPDGALYYVAEGGGQVRRMTLVGPTTTTTTSSTTTTTIPGGPNDETLAGSKLSLRSVRNDPATAKKLGVQDKDPAITLGAGNGSADDPTINGATLRVRGTTFDVTYPLPASGWTYIRNAGDDRGYKYKDKLQANGPIKSGTIQNGKRVKASGAGAGLGFTLASDPSPVDVVLTTGNTRYCATFGGTTKFKPESFSAKKAPPPAACP